MNIFEISGYTAIILVATAIVVPGIAVPALFLTPIALCIWVLGECVPQEEKKEATIKK